MRRVSRSGGCLVGLAVAALAASALGEDAASPGLEPEPPAAVSRLEPPAHLEDGRPSGLEPDGRWVFVDKSERLMIVNAPGFRLAARVALGFAPEGDKQAAGDGRTPEGEYYVCQRVRSNRFHRFLGLSYPSPEDLDRTGLAALLMPLELRTIRAAFRRRGRPPWNTGLGGNVGIHGWGRRRGIEERHLRGEDWTDGCIGVTNREVEAIYPHVPLGTRVVIVP